VPAGEPCQPKLGAIPKEREAGEGRGHRLFEFRCDDGDRDSRRQRTGQNFRQKI
jgi:hypothetical protein